MEYISGRIQAIYDYLIVINTSFGVSRSREFESHQVHHKVSDTNGLKKLKPLVF